MSTQHGELNKHVLPADSVLTPVFEQLRTFNTSQNDERKHDEKTRILVDITYQLPYLLEHLDGLVGSEIVALGYVADFLESDPDLLADALRSRLNKYTGALVSDKPNSTSRKQLTDLGTVLRIALPSNGASRVPPDSDLDENHPLDMVKDRISSVYTRLTRDWLEGISPHKKKVRAVVYNLLFAAWLSESDTVVIKVEDLIVNTVKSELGELVSSDVNATNQILLKWNKFLSQAITQNTFQVFQQLKALLDGNLEARTKLMNRRGIDSDAVKFIASISQHIRMLSDLGHTSSFTKMLNPNSLEEAGYITQVLEYVIGTREATLWELLASYRPPPIMAQDAKFLDTTRDFQARALLAQSVIDYNMSRLEKILDLKSTPETLLGLPFNPNNYNKLLVESLIMLLFPTLPLASIQDTFMRAKNVRQFRTLIQHGTVAISPQGERFTRTEYKNQHLLQHRIHSLTIYNAREITDNKLPGGFFIIIILQDFPTHKFQIWINEIGIPYIVTSQLTSPIYTTKALEDRLLVLLYEHIAAIKCPNTTRLANGSFHPVTAEQHSDSDQPPLRGPHFQTLQEGRRGPYRRSRLTNEDIIRLSGSLASQGYPMPEDPLLAVERYITKLRVNGHNINHLIFDEEKWIDSILVRLALLPGLTYEGFLAATQAVRNQGRDTQVQLFRGSSYRTLRQQAPNEVTLTRSNQ
ncbi:hypothetical protein H6763_01720 [Candidatus Nomurabacteria bacterium]|nr:hypothetical protein [Candidatus Nomurabacteria bacterium]MCB9803525.1 hypothetical protein [Candidatus Nomurabacteria bacterium]